MASVFMMRHHGVLCAVPAAQVISVLTVSGDTEPLELWPDSHPRPPERHLHVRTARGERSMSCTEPRLMKLAAGEVFALPPLVHRELERSFVVGVARVATDWSWLVDLERLSI